MCSCLAWESGCGATLEVPYAPGSHFLVLKSESQVAQVCNTLQGPATAELALGFAVAAPGDSDSVLHQLWVVEMMRLDVCELRMEAVSPSLWKKQGVEAKWSMFLTAFSASSTVPAQTQTWH